MTEKKVSSEKDIDKKTKKTKKVKEEVSEINPDVVPETMEEWEMVADLEASRAREKNAQKELELLKEQIRLLQEANKKAKEENDRLLELSARVLDAPLSPKQAETCLVKCLELNGVELSSPNRDVIITLPYDEWVECDVNELNQIFKKISNRTLFEDGICIMQDNALERFRIKVKTIIDMDKICSLLDEGDEGAIVKEFNNLSDGKRKVSVCHLILYTIVGKMLDGELNRVPRASIETLENYFGVRLKDVETLLKIFRQIKR